jgi:hypothetical protein
MITTTGLARLGNGAAIHITDARGILCNRWGTVNGVWKAPQPVAGDSTQATCKRCQKLAQAPDEASDLAERTAHLPNRYRDDA